MRIIKLGFWAQLAMAAMITLTSIVMVSLTHELIHYLLNIGHEIDQLCLLGYYPKYLFLGWGWIHILGDNLNYDEVIPTIISLAVFTATFATGIFGIFGKIEVEE